MQALRPFWMETVNKWHARLHFGSEQAKQKMKMFNKTVWQQVRNPCLCFCLIFCAGNTFMLLFKSMNIIVKISYNVMLR